MEDKLISSNRKTILKITSLNNDSEDLLMNPKIIVDPFHKYFNEEGINLAQNINNTKLFSNKFSLMLRPVDLRC